MGARTIFCAIIALQVIEPTSFPGSSLFRGRNREDPGNEVGYCGTSFKNLQTPNHEFCTSFFVQHLCRQFSAQSLPRTLFAASKTINMAAGDVFKEFQLPVDRLDDTERKKLQCVFLALKFMNKLVECSSLYSSS